MKVTEEMIREVILEVLREMEGDGRSAGAGGEASTPLQFNRIGTAKQGMDKSEVVVAIPPAFGTAMTKTIIGIPHRQVLREIMAGVEEEGLKARLIKVYRTADVAFMSHDAAKLSGSGIGIGVQSRGTAVIHQRDLKPLQNLRAFLTVASIGPGDFSRHGTKCGQVRKGRKPTAGAGSKRSHGKASLPGTGGTALQQRGSIRGSG